MTARDLRRGIGVGVKGVREVTQWLRNNYAIVPSCSTIAQELRLETLKNKGKCLATGTFCELLRRLL